MVALFGSGCLDQLLPDRSKEAATAMSPQPDLSPAPQDPSGGDDAAPQGAPTDLAMAQAPTGGDLAMPASGGKLAFGATCTVGTDCQSGYCENVMMALICTVPCTNKGMADPACPSDGMCNQNGFCK